MDCSNTQKAIKRATTAGGRAGATTAAFLCFVAVMLPVTASTFLERFVPGWLVGVLILTFPVAAVAALLGYAAGFVAAGASNRWIGGLAGAVISFTTSITIVLYLSSAAAIRVDTAVRLVLFTGSIGVITGAVAWRAANQCLHPQPTRQFQVSLDELVLLITAIAAHLAAYAIR